MGQEQNSDKLLAVTQTKKEFNLNAFLEGQKGEFARALGRLADPDRFTRVLISAVRGNEAVMSAAKKNPISLLKACIEIAQWGLDPSVPNEAYLIPYGDKVQAQLGYKGLARLAMDSARNQGVPLVVLSADTIHKNDRYERRKGSNPEVIHEPPPFGEERGPVIGYVAVSKDSEGRISFEEMTVDEVQTHKKRFSRAKGGPLTDPANFDRYGAKTVLRLLINRNLSMSSKMADAIKKDIALETGETVEEAITEESEGVPGRDANNPGPLLGESTQEPLVVEANEFEKEQAEEYKKGKK